MPDIANELDEAARAGNEKEELSDEGMPLDRDDIPHGSKEDPGEGPDMSEPEPDDGH
jgi:hypothetical protein